MALFAQGRGLVIGVGEYQDERWRAPVTVRDAEAVFTALTDPQVGGYPASQVMRMYDERATRELVLAGLKRLAGAAQATDTAVIFFCGHGALGDDGQYYFATHDTVFTPSQKIQAGTGLSAPELLEQLRAIKAQKLLLIVNACFAGHLQATATLGAAADGLGAPPSSTFNAEVLATGEGRVILSASRPSQYSYYPQQAEHTHFGQALLDGLRGKGVANSDGYVGLYELYTYIYKYVTTTVGKLGGAQEPVITVLRGVGPFPVAHYPGATPSGLGAPHIQQQPTPGTAVEVVERTVVQAIGDGALAINVGNNSPVNVNQGVRINFGSGNRLTGVNFGDIAGGNITNIPITITIGAAAAVDSRQELLNAIGALRDDVERLTGVPRGKQEDAEDELRKARRAGDDRDQARMVEKLESAQKILMELGASNPNALKLSAAIGALLQRARAL